jgi:hypothetical protein
LSAYKFRVINRVTSFSIDQQNPYAEISFDQQKANKALQLVALLAMLVRSD